MVSSQIAPLTATDRQQRAYEAANLAFYERVDWALDVRDAELDEIDLRGVPGELVRYEPRDGARVTREAARRGTWRGLDLSGTWWDAALENVAKSPYESGVLVAPRRNPAYRRLVDGLKILRDAGVAAPDQDRSARVS